MPAGHYPPRPTPPRPAAEVLAGVYLSPAARALLTPTMGLSELLRSLAAARLYSDAVAVVAHTLPPRLRVWWACICLRTLGPIDMPAAARANFDAILRWLREPTPANASAAAATAAVSGPGVLGYRLASALADTGDNRRAAELFVEALLAAVAGLNYGGRLARQCLIFAIDVENGTLPLPGAEHG